MHFSENVTLIVFRQNFLFCIANLLDSLFVIVYKKYWILQKFVVLISILERI